MATSSQKQPDTLPDDLFRVTISADEKLWNALWKLADEREKTTHIRTPLVQLITEILSNAVAEHCPRHNITTASEISFPFAIYQIDQETKVLRSFDIQRLLWANLRWWSVLAGINIKDIVTSILYAGAAAHYEGTAALGQFAPPDPPAAGDRSTRRRKVVPRGDSDE